MGQTEIIIDVVQRQLLAYAVLVFAQRGDAPANRSYMLAQRQVEALDKGFPIVSAEIFTLDAKRRYISRLQNRFA